VAGVLFAPVRIAFTLIAGLIGKKIFDVIWARIDDQEAPEPEHRDIEMRKLATALAIEGAIFRVVRGLLDHSSRRSFARLTGRWPGEEQPDPT
jgi:hypothetical protein